MSYLRSLRSLRTPPCITHHGRSCAEQHARALERCRMGRHTMRDTLATGEQRCTTCGFITYCPLCIPTYRIQHPTSRAHAFLRAMHRSQEGES